MIVKAGIKLLKSLMLLLATNLENRCYKSSKIQHYVLLTNTIFILSALATPL
ncbi:hypothetical protein SAMN04488541_10674 [Thermoflexibacter ruber]|uniref:Uncharacterized protein n=1 Tax=Thermoflexibacter ruber TaxID=1003 RepID=A0A1I2JZ66_9BACT|nr:hypothetical protein SAMN04488541_10674 [Thermoflexibacter ruber]